MGGNIYWRPLVLRAIDHNAHAVIEASAGTGKTHAIEHLIIDLLLSTPCAIEQILVVTFTEKASGELRGRVRKLLDDVLRSAREAVEGGDDEAILLTDVHHSKLRAALSTFESAPIFTVHAFCQRMLAELAFHSGMRFDPEVIDGRRAFHHAFRAELRRFAAEPEIRGRLDEWLKRDGIDDLESFLFEVHRRRYLESTPLSATGTQPGGEPVEAPRSSSPAAGLEVWLVDRCLPRVVARLEAFKRERGLVDYDDMLGWMWRALQGAGGAAMVSALRERFCYALVDEFQDTDDLQWRILRRIFIESPGQNRLYVVGDPKQAIYGFRGADVHAYLSARQELRSAGAPFVPLVLNFRSTSDLIEASNLILDQHAAAALFTGEIRHERPAKCGRPDRKATDAAGKPVVPITLMRYEAPDGRRGASEARAAMGRHIAATLRRLLFDGEHQIRIEQRNEAPRIVTGSGVYVLTRSHKESEEIGQYLRGAGVPFAFYKLDGLFQTREACDVLDVLRAVEQPHVRSRRLKGWASPFFGIPLRDLGLLGDLPPAHPLNERLDEWRALAQRERFAELFDRLLHESGLAERELFLSDGERQLTNYLHILEILLERAATRRLSLSGVIALLEDYVAGRAFPPGMEGNVQRLESEREAVQVMTVHMAKGLEGDVVVLYGGMHRSWKRGPFAVYHAGRERRFAIGEEAVKAVKDRLLREEQEEDQRLLYVALTRARAKLYLPLFPQGSIKKKLDGYYTGLNNRLNEIADASKREGGPKGLESELFAVESVRDTGGSGVGPEASARPLSVWLPPEKLLGEDGGPEPPFATLRRAHAPFVTASYSSLKRFEGSGEREVTPEDFKGDLETPAETADLPGGSEVGLFLHEVIERLDLSSFGRLPDLVEWTRREDVRNLFRSVMWRRGVRDQRWFERGCEVVFNALTVPLALGDRQVVGPLYGCRSLREMEFIYPIPQLDHPMLARPRDAAWTAERGYLKGFVDFVFEHHGLVYFADWKSDLLPSYGADTIADHVRRHYELQARIYSVGVVRLLRVTSEAEYENRFGGLLYIFLRGVRTREGAGSVADGAADGVYFHRPRWPEICRYESELMEIRDL